MCFRPTCSSSFDANHQLPAGKGHPGRFEPGQARVDFGTNLGHRRRAGLDESRFKGRGSTRQPVNRFTQHELIPDPEYLEWLHRSGEELKTPTQLSWDSSKRVISRNLSPDIPFEFSINPYRGCEHGCSYCYARPSHEFLGYSAGLDFETKLVAKRDAAAVLTEELSAPSWDPSKKLVLSGVTDPYQPVEKELELTRSCLKVLAFCRQPVEIITKNYLVTRDLPLLAELAQYEAAAVNLSITTLDPELANKLEPRASTPARRLKAIERLTEAGIPVGVMASPMVPGLNDHELPSILKAAADAGARWAASLPIRLPLAVAPLFLSWLERHYPERRAKVVRLIRELRGGKLNESEFHQRFKGQGEVAKRLQQLFELGRKRAGLKSGSPELKGDSFEPPHSQQLSLF